MGFSSRLETRILSFQHPEISNAVGVLGETRIADKAILMQVFPRELACGGGFGGEGKGWRKGGRVTSGPTRPLDWGVSDR